MSIQKFRTLPALLLWCWVPLVAMAGHDEDAEPPEFQAGYGDIKEFGGPDSVSGQLKQADEASPSTFHWKAPERWLRPWYDWKARIKQDHGLAMGFFVSILGQTASDTTTGNDDALGGIYRFQGNWALINRGGSDPGRIEWRIENRSNITSRQAPGNLGKAIGAGAVNSGFGYAESFDTDISVLNWTQGFRDERIGIAVGRLAFDVHLDAMVFQTFSRGFLNQAFLVNPTVATPGIGALGAVAKFRVGKRFFVGGQIYDANAVSGEFDWDTIQEHEYLKAIEFGWSPSYADRRTNKIQFTYWDKDEREAAGIPSGRGWAVSASWQFGGHWLPFLRFGHSDGGAGVAADSAVSGGFEYTVRADQAWTFGVGWAEPANRPPGTDAETVIETSYKFQVAKNMSLMPDLQLVLDPVNNPAEGSVWVFGLRLIMTL